MCLGRVPPPEHVATIRGILARHAEVGWTDKPVWWRIYRLYAYGPRWKWYDKTWPHFAVSTVKQEATMNWHIYCGFFCVVLWIVRTKVAWMNLKEA